MVELFFQDPETLVADLAERIGRSLQEHIAAHGWASMAVSGGLTPKPLFKRLSSLDISWQDVVITLVDERWIAPTSP
ncbi:MAG: 6-phosphogluconolactonase, partial [Candidatus Electrothrix sp. AUS4]|nr:6-phosphogluconolactonase [Candidatus Electrothrix sp. AUS4]